MRERRIGSARWRRISNVAAASRANARAPIPVHSQNLRPGPATTLHPFYADATTEHSRHVTSHGGRLLMRKARMLAWMVGFLLVSAGGEVWAQALPSPSLNIDTY